MSEQALTDLTPEKESWEDRFLGLLADTGNVTRAAKGARITRQTAYNHRASRADFAERWAEAEELGANALEDECRRRAFKGSDTLLIFLLKAHKPEKYREVVRNEFTGEGGGPIELVYRRNWRSRVIEEIDDLEAAEDLPALPPSGPTEGAPVEPPP